MFSSKKLILLAALLLLVGNVSTAYQVQAAVLDKQTGYASDVDDYDDSYYDDYATPQVSDPLESFNRAMYKFNEGVDNVILKPLAKAYRFAVPEWGRDRVGSFLRNLHEPVVLANSILQGDVQHSITTFWRIFFNTTFGLGGLFDFAESVGLSYRQEDFGQTMGRYGVGSGPYLVLPLLGPTTIRDITGDIVDIFVTPTTYMIDDAETYIAYKAVQIIDEREGLLDLTDQIERTSFDRYSTVRSLYLQSRASAVKNGRDIQAP